MDKEDVQKPAEELFSFQLRASEDSDREDYGAAIASNNHADALETLLNDAGYTIEEDKDNLDIMHILAEDGTRYGSFNLAEWRWVVESEQ